MEPNYIFENHDKHRHHGGYGASTYPRKYPTYELSKHSLLYLLLIKIWNNKKLRIAFIIVAILVVLLVILLLIALIPMIFKLIEYITQSGVQGIIDSITGFINKIWKGTGNN